jgi:hypothetical protein
MLALLLLVATPGGLSDWQQRAALAADRLAVAAVDEQAGTRGLSELWWSGEGQQVFELLDHRACVGSVQGGCLEGSGLPSKPARAQRLRYQGRLRWDYSDSSKSVLALEIVGTKSVLWAWREREQAPLLAAGSAPAIPDTPSSLAVPVVNQESPWAWVFGALMLLFSLWRLALQRRAQKELNNWRGLADGLEENLEEQGLKATVSSRCFENEIAKLRIENAKLQTMLGESDDLQFEKLEDRLERVAHEWQRLRSSVHTEAEVSRRDGALFLAPLQQLGGMLAQIETRMRAVDEQGFADKIQARRLGLQSYAARLRNHFESSTRLDARSWQHLVCGLDELLLPGEQPSSPAQAQPKGSSSARLTLLRGGR